MAPSPKKKSKKQTTTKKKKSGGTTKRRNPAFGGNISWKSKNPQVEEEDTMPLQTKIAIAIGAFILFMIALYVFVDDRPPMTTPTTKPARNTSTTSHKEFTFEHAVLVNSSTLIETIETQSEDRLIVVTFDDSSAAPAPDTAPAGKPTRLRLFRRMETLARSLPRKRAFKIYEDEELPLIVLFDCGNNADGQAEDLCNRILSNQPRPSIIVYANKRARPLPSEYRSDKQIVTYLHSLMQPPVKYLEERTDAEEFVAKDGMNVLYFGKDSDAYTAVADNLRDFARFGRCQNPAIIESFLVEDDIVLPQLAVWRTFGSNPLLFPVDSGNVSDGQQLTAFVLNNYLPLCGEFNAKTQPRYMKRQLPVAFVIVDGKNMKDDDLTRLVDEVSGMARSYLGAVSFATLDAGEYPQLVENIGIVLGDAKENDDETDEDDDGERSDGDEESERDVLPQIAIHVQQYQKHGAIDMTDIRTSVFNVVDGYVEQLRQQQAEQHRPVDEGEIEDDDELVDEDMMDEPPDPEATPQVSAPKVEV